VGGWWETFFDDVWLKAGFGAVTRRPTLSHTAYTGPALSLKKISPVTGVCRYVQNALKLSLPGGDLLFERDSTWRQ
jgi:hypothetical protein